MATVPSHRASDSDRELVAERLRHATAEGRLSADELEERLEALYAARTYGELDTLVADLPISSLPGRVRFPRWAVAAGAATLVLTVLGALADAGRHSAAAIRGPRHAGQFRVPGPFADPHHGFIIAASMVGVLAVLVVCAAVVWLLMHSRATSDPWTAFCRPTRAKPRYPAAQPGIPNRLNL